MKVSETCTGGLAFGGCSGLSSVAGANHRVVEQRTHAAYARFARGPDRRLCAQSLGGVDALEDPRVVAIADGHAVSSLAGHLEQRVAFPRQQRYEGAAQVIRDRRCEAQRACVGLVPSLSTSGETLTIEELLTLRARTENAGHGDDYERSTTGC